MITKEDLIGKWVIKQTVLKNPTPDSQKEIDTLNSKYLVEYNKNDYYNESNNGILMGRLSNFTGNYTLDDNNYLTMSIKAFAFNRKYLLESVNSSNSEIKFYPQDTLYCNIYCGISYLILKKV